MEGEIESGQVENLSPVISETPASAAETVQTVPDSALPPAPAPAVEKTAPELTLREKIQKKADEVAAKRDASGKFASQKGASSEKTTQNQVPASPQAGAQKPGETGQKAPETPAFTPNFKFKVMDKELEVPKFLQEAVKSPADEKALKELMEKAYGLDYVKPKYQETREQLKQVGTQFSSLNGQINECRQMYQRGDLDGFFKRLAIPEDTILQWVAKKIELQQLPPEQRNVIVAQKQAEERAWQAEQQVAHFQSTHEQMLSQQVQMALDSELSKPDVKAVQDAYDARMGAGAFKQEIGRRGDYYWRTNGGQIVPPSDVVKEMMSVLGPLAPPAQPATTAASGTPVAPNAAPAGMSAKPATPVLPNISGRSGSVVKSQIRSIDDLKKRYKESQQAQ